MMNETVQIEGYASIFNVADLNGDVVRPGAFSASLRKKCPGAVRMLYQHAAETPIGRWLRFEEDSRGLYAVGELVLDSRAARETYALLKGRAIDGLSIGFQTVRATRHDRSAQRFILEADLWEVSVVTFPMAPGARVVRVGDAGTDPVTPDAEALLFASAMRVAAKILSA